MDDEDDLDDPGVQDEIADDQGVLEVEDEAVPLISGGLAGIQHNFQHVCEAFASGFLPLVLFGSNRKRRKEVSELEKQIGDGTGRKEN